MKRLIEVVMEDGTTLLAEVDSISPAAGTMRGTSPSQLIEKTRETFESSINRIKPLATVIIEKLRDMSQQPEQVVVEFGIKLGAEAGVVLASSSVEANFKVALTWKNGQK